MCVQVKSIPCLQAAHPWQRGAYLHSLTPKQDRVCMMDQQVADNQDDARTAHPPSTVSSITSSTRSRFSKTVFFSTAFLQQPQHYGCCTNRQQIHMQYRTVRCSGRTNRHVHDRQAGRLQWPQLRRCGRRKGHT